MSGRPEFVKVCGVTRLHDARLVADAGADAIGFIFWPGSPRYVAPQDARDIVRGKASEMKAVGVFVDEPVDRVREISDLVGLDFVQLHGAESAADVHQLNSTLHGGVIRAIGLKQGALPYLVELDEDVLLLLDAHDPARHGGTGRTIDWDAAREIAKTRRTILSGGLTPENVAGAVAAVQPYGIDVSSGVESSPGVKDPVRLKRFFEALND
jgi:phosphoribosylanthranilate isomerase